MDTNKANPVNWREFMNGYRDPITRAEDRAALREEFEESGLTEEEFFGGGMSSGGDGLRECGSRKEGGTYAVVPTSRLYGTPVEGFLLCKPVPVNKDEYNLSNVGVRLVDLEQTCLDCDGKPSKGSKTCQTCYGTGVEVVTHVFDIIGQEYYPNVADFIEEVRRMGVSRRLELETSKEYARLSKRSRLYFLHHRAIIKNPEALYDVMGDMELARLDRAGCPKHLPEHNYNVNWEGIGTLIPSSAFKSPGCSALYWNVLEEGGEVIPELYAPFDDLAEKEEALDSRFVERKLASGTYRGYALPFEVKAKTELGIFAIFPLGKIEVVDPDGEYEDRVERASAARLDVEATEC